jgi:hypothetical protein
MRTILPILALSLIIPATTYGQAPGSQGSPGTQTPGSSGVGSQRPQDRQSPGSTQSTSTSGQREPGTQMVEGELERVDSQRKMLTIKGKDGKDSEITYNDQTKVQGAEAIQGGLRSASGDTVKVHFSEQGATKMAVLIEVESEQAGSQSRPSSGAQSTPGSQPQSQPRPGAQPGSQPGTQPRGGAEPGQRSY